MKSGLFPGQHEAMARRIALAERQARERTRRLLLVAVTLAGLAGAASGSLATWTITARAAGVTPLDPAPPRPGR